MSKQVSFFWLYSPESWPKISFGRKVPIWPAQDSFLLVWDSWRNFNFSESVISIICEPKWESQQSVYNILIPASLIVL